MKQKRQLVTLLGLLAIAGAVWLWYFWSRRAGTNSGAGPIAQDYQLITAEDPHIRMEEIARARATEYRTTGRNIFAATAVPAQASRPHANDPAKIVVNTPCGVYGPCQPPPPEPPKLPPNVKFYGYGSGRGGPRRAFLYDGEEVSIVNEGQLFLNRFRILKIGNASLEFEEVSTGRKGTAPLEEQAASPPA